MRRSPSKLFPVIGSSNEPCQERSRRVVGQGGGGDGAARRADVVETAPPPLPPTSQSCSGLTSTCRAWASRGSRSPTVSLAPFAPRPDGVVVELAMT